MGPASFGKAHPALTLQCFIEIQDEKAKVPPASDEVLAGGTNKNARNATIPGAIGHLA